MRLPLSLSSDFVDKFLFYSVKIILIAVVVVALSLRLHELKKKLTSEYKRYTRIKVLTISQLFESKRALCNNVLIRGDVRYMKPCRENR